MHDTITAEAQGNLAVTFTAEAASSDNGRVFVRALVDGQPAVPSDVVLAAGGWDGTRSFTFTQRGLAAGVHRVQLQWHADSGKTAHLGDRSLVLQSGTETSLEGRLFLRSAPSGPFVQTSTASWQDIPDMTLPIAQTTPGSLQIDFSAEAFVSSNGRMFVRALVDGVAAHPGNVVFALGGWRGTHAMTFQAENVPAGSHTLVLQWFVDQGQTASLGDRSLNVYAAAPCDAQGGLALTNAPSGVVQNSTATGWQNIPDMTVNVAASSDGAMAIRFSAEAFSPTASRLFVRALVDGQTTSPSDAVLAEQGLNGTHAFSFTKDHLAAGPHSIELQWHTDAGGTISVGDRELSVISLLPQRWHRFAHMDEPHTFLRNPDIPVSLPSLWSDENATATLPVLVVLLDFDDRRALPEHDVKYYTDLFFAQNRADGRPSVFETYLENSNGRLKLVPATAGDYYGAADGIVGWVTAAPQTGCCRNASGDAVDATQSQCQQMGGTWTPGSFAYYSGFIQRKRAEAIRQADKYFDFSAYDRNGDHIITSDELLVIAVNADPNFGANARNTDPRDVPVDTGQFQVTQLVTGTTEGTHTGVMAHEIGHQALGLTDLYRAGGTTVSDGYVTGNGTWYPPDPARYSLMGGNNPASILSHLDPWAKLHLGFIKPKVVTQDSWCSIFDMETERSFADQELHPEAIILYDPDRPDPYKEYFILENRDRLNRSNGTGAPVLDRGLAVWHITERDGSWPNGLELRRTIRLIRRGGYWASELNSLWDGANTTDGYDLTPTSSPRNTRWADGSPSYIHITDISPAGPVMTFKVRMPLVDTPDSDHDGIPDRWEMLNGLDWTDPADGDYDTDQDGLNNREEFQAGTQPYDASSRLHLEVLPGAASGQILIRFEAAADRNYTLEYVDDLSDRNWHVLHTIGCAPNVRTITLTENTASSPKGHRFYRLQVTR